MAKQNPFKRPRMSGQELLEVQASQSRTLNGQAAREQLAATKPSDSEEAILPASSEDPGDTTTSLAAIDTTETKQPVQQDSSSLSDDSEGGGVEPAVIPPATPEPTSTIIPVENKAVASTPQVSKPRGPGRPSRAAVAAAVPELVGNSASSQEAGLKGVIHLKPDVAMQLRQASMDMLSKGKRITMKQLAEEGALFYLQYLRDSRELPPLK